jgi:DNA-binding MarR family transcriptional regulator
MLNEADKIFSPCHCAILRKASRHISQAYDLALAPVGIKTTQFSLLAAIHHGGEPLTISELAKVMVMDRSTLGHNLRPLERNGLITIEAGQDDTRRRRIRLTSKGRVKLKKTAVLWKKMQARFESAVGSKATRELHAALLRLATTDFRVR